jgi:flagellar motor switch protein FliM
VGYSEQATSGARPRRGEVRTYDFRRPVRLAREHSHVLRVAMHTFGRQTSTVLTTGLRVVCQLANARIEELSYDEYLSSLGEATVSLILSLDPWPGKALLSFDLPTLLTMVDHQLGGHGAAEQPDRPLTDIEQALIRTVMIRVMRELSYAFEPIAHVSPHLLAMESDARFVQAAAPTDPVVVAQMQLTVGARESAVSLCLPFAMIGPALTNATARTDSGDKARQRLEAAQMTQQRLNDVEVDVSVRFDPVSIRSGRLAKLDVGDVITLNHRTTSPLTVTSAATVFAQAVPGTSGKKLAVLVVDTPHSVEGTR